MQSQTYQLSFTGSSSQISEWETAFLTQQSTCYSVYNSTTKRNTLSETYDQALSSCENYFYYVVNSCIDGLSDKTGFGVTVERLVRKCVWQNA